MSQTRYGDAIYQTERHAQNAAIDDYLTACGTEDVSDAVDEDETARSIAQDMIEDLWVIPGIPYAPGTAGEVVDRMADAIRDRLAEHGLDVE